MTPDNYEKLSGTGSGAQIQVDITWPYANATELFVWQENAGGEVHYAGTGEFTIYPDPDHLYVLVDNYWGDGVEATAYVARLTPRTQTYNIGEGPLNPTALIAQFDKTMRIIQEIVSKVPMTDLQVLVSKDYYSFPTYEEINNTYNNRTTVNVVSFDYDTNSIEFLAPNTITVVTGVSVEGNEVVASRSQLTFFGEATPASSQTIFTAQDVEVMSELILDGGEALIKTKRQLKVLGATDTYAGEVFVFTPVSAVYEVELDDNTLKRTSFGFNALVLDPEATDEEDIMEFEQKNITIDVGTSSSSSGSGSRKLIETKQSVLVGKVSGATEANNDLWSMTKKSAYTDFATSLGDSQNSITLTKTELWVWDDGDDTSTTINLDKIDVIIDFQVDDTKLQTKTRQVTVWETHGSDPSWTTEHTGTTC